MILRLMCFLLIAGMNILCMGCSNPFSKYYVDLLNGVPIDEMPSLRPHDGEPEVHSSQDLDKDSLTMMENGFRLIGYSRFNAPIVQARGAVSQAKKVKAAVVLIESDYSHTAIGSIPCTTYQQGTVYGSGGYATYSGTGTAYMPYSIARYDYTAAFWVEIRGVLLGVHVKDLTPELKASVERNTGAVVMAVVKDSPAFRANIVNGDVITEINGESIVDADDVPKVLRRYAGQHAVIELIRKGQPRIIEVNLHKPAWLRY